MYTLENYIPFILQNNLFKSLVTRVGVKNTFLFKEVIQPQVPLRLPCYDFIPITSPTIGRCFPKVSSHTSGRTGFHDVTGGVYKTRERIHRDMLIRDY